MIGLVVGSDRTGPMQILLTPEGAQHVAAHLTAMVGDLDTLRDEANRKDGTDD